MLTAIRINVNRNLTLNPISTNDKVYKLSCTMIQIRNFITIFYRPVILPFYLIRHKKWNPNEESQNAIVKKIEEMLPCSTTMATSIYEKFPTIRSEKDLRLVKTNIDFVVSQGISITSILDNSFLLVMKKGLKNINTLILSSLHINDLVPQM